jgi:hypothetical protein
MGNLFLNEISETILRVTETPWMMSTGDYQWGQATKIWKTYGLSRK